MSGRSTSLLPSVLRPRPAVPLDPTPEELAAAAALGKVTSPEETPLFICAFSDCFRLFPSRERLMTHRKRDHNSDDPGKVITWNE
ncbi:C2H2-type domain-containing protein [Mycena indigotica]|uniref:C2H2-type domain-containing protein n=1 Tax=Mycena indigotica TaxID=2126181 RepID=A0A8H6SV51_9AGAR|nr:C2H2-type domain-containing protein [Mycena indigotica]KAF7306755.1 C2H2-type domain-containing protein [Mycena indigotica]